MVFRILKAGWGIPLIFLVLLGGVFGGFVRIGWLQYSLQGISVSHGLLMTGAFMGSLISLERNMAMRSPWWGMVPFVCISSTIFFYLGELSIGLMALLTASTGLAIMLYLQLASHFKIGKCLMFIGALSWLMGNIMVYKSNMIPMGSIWWEAFILFTILGERIELGEIGIKFIGETLLFWLFLGLFIVGMVLPFHGIGPFIMGCSIIGIGLWFLVKDRKSMVFSRNGRNQFNSMAILLGYIWLIVHGLWMILGRDQPFFYDVMVHSFFLGFAFSMIWGHVSSLFPMICGLNGNAFHPRFWWGLAIFETSLLGRIGACVLESSFWRQFFSVANGIILLILFMLIIFHLVMRVNNKKT